MNSDPNARLAALKATITNAPFTTSTSEEQQRLTSIQVDLTAEIWMLTKDHQRITAELRAQVERLPQELPHLVRQALREDAQLSRQQQSQLHASVDGIKALLNRSVAIGTDNTVTLRGLAIVCAAMVVAVIVAFILR